MGLSMGFSMGLSMGPADIIYSFIKLTIGLGRLFIISFIEEKKVAPLFIFESDVK